MTMATGMIEARAQAPRPCALRPVVVAASLADLHGPTGGLVELPQRLFWSGAERVFDLSDPDRLLELYEVVFDAARTEADLAEYLHGDTLARIWTDLALAPRVRDAWEGAHPGLSPARPLGTIPAQCPAGTFAEA
jgi:hypothetical protein